MASTSSLIAAYTKAERPDISAYVADVGGQLGEGAQAERVGQHLGVPVKRVLVDRQRFLRLWPDAVWHYDGPPTNPMVAALLAVLKTCRQDGVKVLLTGEGSDELFGGYDWLQTTYNDWLNLNSWGTYFSRGRVLQNHLNIAPFSTITARTDPDLRQRLMIALDSDWELLPARFLAHLTRVMPEADRAFLAHTLCSLYHHLSGILHSHDRIGMAASMEMRVPFLENDLFDFAFHLPRRAKLHRKVGKWIVKEAAAEILPKDIVYAPKKGFPIPPEFSRGMQNMLTRGVLPELMEWPAQTVCDVMSTLNKHGWLRFQIVSLELWARIFFDGQTPATVGEKLLDFAEFKSHKQSGRFADAQTGRRSVPIVGASRHFTLMPVMNQARKGATMFLKRSRDHLKKAARKF